MFFETVFLDEVDQCWSRFEKHRSGRVVSVAAIYLMLSMLLASRFPLEPNQTVEQVERERNVHNKTLQFKIYRV